MQVADTHADELLWLVHYLEQERFGETSEGLDGWSADDLWTRFRALVNTREPQRASDEFYARQDALLQALINETGVTDAADLPRSKADGRLSVWRGDITTIRADAIVNAANSQMLGCWVPGHHCIDNAIHTFAGVELREECARIMVAQGHEEPTAHAKVTGGYNLPARHVIHTVGPIAGGRPTARHRLQLAECYESCLDAATEAGCRSVVFCCISTGIFGFPQREAAEIAVRTVRRWLDAHAADSATTVDHVVFNVFLPADEQIYRSLI